MPIFNDRGAYFSRVLDDGRVIDVEPLTFGRAQLVISQDVDAEGWEDGWHYGDPMDACYAALVWNGEPGTEPDGWEKHVNSRRYRPDGDPSREYVKE